MKDSWGKDGLHRMTNSVAEIDKISETCLTLIDGNDMRLDGDRASDDSQQEFLCFRACGLDASGIIQGGGLDGSEDFR